MKFNFTKNLQWPNVSATDWQSWTWQLRNSIETAEQLARHINLSPDEIQGLELEKKTFRFRTTPYSVSTLDPNNSNDPLRLIQIPRKIEIEDSVAGAQHLFDPLAERKHSPVPRVIHRYPDRVLLLVTDTCSVYCRYCTRKHFTASDQASISPSDFDRALGYIKQNQGIREVILSGGDPLVLSDGKLIDIIERLRRIDSVEIIRIGTRMPVVCPMRISDELVHGLKKYHPIYMMVHFNHPREITQEAAEALTRLVDHGFPVFNQMVLLNGVNNHPAIVQALSRRLLYLRVKPYYAFQADPSQGTNHLRTSVQQTREIQRELWGRLSGLAMPNFSIDIPGGGGKVGVVPDFVNQTSVELESYTGWDGIKGQYLSPVADDLKRPAGLEPYIEEWERLRGQPYGLSLNPLKPSVLGHELF